MFKRPSTDMWRCGYVTQPIETVLRDGVKPSTIRLLPSGASYRFWADPFGVEANGQPYIFMEGYDYRTKHGTIDVRYPDGRIQTTLKEPWHLSYPFVFMHEGQFYMLPEAHRSGRLTLYRATKFPEGWEPCATLLDFGAIDASLMHWGDRWWLFYTCKDGNGGELETLHLAYSDDLFNAFTPHPQNPVWRDRTGARPGGTPFMLDGCVHLPTQNCAASYGAGISILRFNTLNQDHVDTTKVAHGEAGIFGQPEYKDGFHTLSAVGAITLFDIKKIDRGWGRVLINLQRRFHTLYRRLFGIGT